MNEAELRQALIVKELEKIKADIEITDRDYKFNGYILPIEVVLEIIDKHIKEINNDHRR